MKLAVAIVTFLLLSILLSGCPKTTAPLERSRKPGNVLTTPTEEGTTDYGTPPPGGVKAPSGDSGSSGSSSSGENDREAGNDEDGD